nr:unnamed protein product [Spirometra erinaceieuropaei]
MKSHDRVASEKWLATLSPNYPPLPSCRHCRRASRERTGLTGDLRNQCSISLLNDILEQTEAIEVIKAFRLGKRADTSSMPIRPLPLKVVLASSDQTSLILSKRFMIKGSSPGDAELPPVEYVKTRIYPILLPILTEMLEEAARRECFERPHFAFNGLDFITLNLYARNPRRCGTTQINQLGDIPWVAGHWKTNPRAPLPLSWQWTSAEAATVLQSHWRGYMVRRMEEVQEMRQWQRDWRAMNRSSEGAAI